VKRLLLLGYSAILLFPLALMVGVVKPGAQGREVIFADALGFAALSLLSLQVFVSGRWATTTRAFGLRAVLALHRQAGMVVVVLVLAHLALLLIADPSRVALLDPLTAPPRARAGVLALLALLAIAVTSVRRRTGSYERWRGLHLGLTTVVLAAAFAHVVWVDAYSSLPAVRWTVLGVVLAAAAGLFWSRVARPYSSTLRRYHVVAVRRERGDAVTVELAAAGHNGLRFQPGQFAWLRAGGGVYGMDEHPFSFSSSALRPERPAFTVKALGDFSASLAGLRIGTPLLLDGPHGEAADDSRAIRGRVLLAAGIGITPALSVIRTAAERDDRRRIVLLYGSRRWQDVTFAEELAALQRRMPSLRVVHVLSRPDPSWHGERGRIGEALLHRYVPASLRDWAALVCGPRAMVAESSAALARLGVATIQAEGF
jgi:predicted ferric reductase